MRVKRPIPARIQHGVPNSLKLSSNTICPFLIFIYLFFKMLAKKGQPNLSQQQVNAKDQHMLTACLQAFIIELFTASISHVVAAVFRVKEPKSHFSNRDHWPENKVLAFYFFPWKLLDSYHWLLNNLMATEIYPNMGATPSPRSSPSIAN